MSPKRTETEESPKNILDLENMEGVGPAKAKKLRDAGINNVEDITASSAEYLTSILGISKDDAANLIIKSIKAMREAGQLRGSFQSAWDELQRKKTIKRCTTGSKWLDELIGGGIETENTTEFYGEAAAGKTQICHTVATLATLSEDQGGFGGNVYWIDAENTFHPERIEQIATARGLDAEDILRNKIFVDKSFSAAHLEFLIRELPNRIRQNNIKLVIVDSIINQHRGEFRAMGNLASRQQSLNDIMHQLERLTSVFKIAVIFTNQIMDAPGTIYGDPHRPVGGNVVAHASGTRVYLTKLSKGSKARLKDSAKLPPGEAMYRITEKGIEDLPEAYEEYQNAKQKELEKQRKEFEKQQALTSSESEQT